MGGSIKLSGYWKRGMRVDVKVEVLQLQTGYRDDPPGGNHCRVCIAQAF